METDTGTLEAIAASSSAEPVEVIRLGKDEMNLAEFPITVLTDRVPKGKKIIQYQDRIFDEKSGTRITRKLTISADEAYGLPTPSDDDVILGLIQLTKTANNFSSREVEFSRRDLIRLLGWPGSGDSYRRLTTSLKRWLSVTLLYENAWRDNRKGAWITKGFHILDNIEINDTRNIGAPGELLPSKITWNKVVFDSFAAGYLKTIDYGLYIKLRHPIARRMYRFLSKRMYFGPDLTFDLRDLAFAHIGLSESYSGNAGKIKEKLQPAIEELETTGFLETMSKESRYQKEGKSWKIRLTAKSEPRTPPPPETGQAPEPPLLVAALDDRGVTKVTAEELVRQFPVEAIEAKIEVFDWLVEKRDKRVAQNPAGYLVKSIQDGYAIPKGFLSRAARQQREEADRKVAENRHQARQEEQRREEEFKAADAYLKRLTPAARAKLEAEVLALADPETRATYEDPAVRMFRDTVMLGMLREHLAQNRKLVGARA